MSEQEAYRDQGCGKRANWRMDSWDCGRLNGRVERTASSDGKAVKSLKLFGMDYVYLMQNLRVWLSVRTIDKH